MSDETTVTAASPIVLALAKLSPEQRRRAEGYAKALRARQIRSAVQRVHKSLLPDWSGWAASHEIEDAVADRRTGADESRLSVRRQIKRQLTDELGSLDDLPKAERIRQHLRE